MFRVFLPVLLCVAVLPSTVMAQVCPTYQIAPVLHSEALQIQYLNDQSSADLTNLRSGDEGFHQAIYGLAGGRVDAQIKTEFEVVPVSGGLYCIKVSQMNADFSSIPEIRIASNFKRGSCEYESVMAHERKHVAILNSAFTEFTPQFRKKLWEVAGALVNVDPLPMEQALEMQGQITADIKAQMGGYVETLNADIANRQQEIDTPDEYQKIKSACGNWESKLSGQ